MGSNLLDGQIDSILRDVFAEAEGEVYVVNPSEESVREVVEAAADVAAPPTIRLLAESKLLRDVLDDFIVASGAADLVVDGVLELRTVEEPPANSVVMTEDSVLALVDAGGRMGGLATDDDTFVDGAHDAYGRAWEHAEEYQLRTPPISRVRETLTTDLGEDAREDFTQVLSSLETARGNGDGLDEVTISLLVAAKNEELFYDISRWGEDVGVASKATFSRMKNELEDTGLIGTEKVPVDVGRPRQRLTIEDDRLRDADGSQLASVAESILA
jgi:hypothetical protein